MTVFADTSALFAVLDHDDLNHGRAQKVWRDLLTSDRRLITTNYVLIEMSALVQARLGLPALRTFHEDVAPLLEVDWITEPCHRIAVEMVLTADRKKLSVVDCTSFQAMRNLGVRTAFTFDRHFREQSFDTLP